MLTGIDYVVVIVYLTGIMLLGFYFKKFVHSSKDFFLAGKTLPFWAIGMSIVVSDIGAIDFVGISGQAYRYGISVGNFDWIVFTSIYGAKYLFERLYAQGYDARALGGTRIAAIGQLIAHTGKHRRHLVEPLGRIQNRMAEL